MADPAGDQRDQRGVGPLAVIPKVDDVIGCRQNHDHAGVAAVDGLGGKALQDRCGHVERPGRVIGVVERQVAGLSAQRRTHAKMTQRTDERDRVRWRRPHRPGVAARHEVLVAQEAARSLDDRRELARRERGPWDQAQHRALGSGVVEHEARLEQGAVVRVDQIAQLVDVAHDVFGLMRQHRDGCVIVAVSKTKEGLVGAVRADAVVCHAAPEPSGDLCTPRVGGGDAGAERERVAVERHAALGVGVGGCRRHAGAEGITTGVDPPRALRRPAQHRMLVSDLERPRNVDDPPRRQVSRRGARAGF